MGQIYVGVLGARACVDACALRARVWMRASFQLFFNFINVVLMLIRCFKFYRWHHLRVHTHACARSFSRDPHLLSTLKIPVVTARGCAFLNTVLLHALLLLVVAVAFLISSLASR